MARSAAQLRAIFASLRGKGPIGRAKRLRKAGLFKFGKVGFGVGGKHLSDSGASLREQPTRAARLLGSKVMRGYDILGKTAAKRRAVLKGGYKSGRY